MYDFLIICMSVNMNCVLNQVRKEKLGDRIAALQQMVAPFGKVVFSVFSHHSKVGGFSSAVNIFTFLYLDTII